MAWSKGDNFWQLAPRIISVYLSIEVALSMEAELEYLDNIYKR